MKKIINGPGDVVNESLIGFVQAYKNIYEKIDGTNGILLRKHRKEKVALVIGGGSGHEPMFSGFVGYGLADAAACGNVFASPDPGTIVKTALAAHAGKGVMFLYGNYAGDNLNFDMAEELLEEEGVKTAHIRVCDDCASAPKERTEDRRGIAGDVFMVKIAGAACDSGMELSEVKRVCEKTVERVRTIGVATSPGQIPGTDKPTFTLAEDEIEYGMGLHGEPGIKRTKMQTADQLAVTLYENLIKDMPLSKGDEICVLVNGLGSTTILEMGIVYRKLAMLLENDAISVYDADINSFCTCMEMGGFSVSFLKLDDEIKKLYNKACYCPYYSKAER